jgi:hypothetical protein
MAGPIIMPEDEGRNVSRILVKLIGSNGEDEGTHYCIGGSVPNVLMKADGRIYMRGEGRVLVRLGDQDGIIASLAGKN